MVNMNEPFPLDWNAWRQRWWDYAPSLGDPLRKTADLVERFPSKNFTADEILGYYQVGEHIVELSEGTGIYHERFIGVTVDAAGSGQGTVVWSFAELDELLATLKGEAAQIAKEKGVCLDEDAFAEETGLEDDVAEAAWYDYSKTDEPLAEWWAEHQGRYI